MPEVNIPAFHEKSAKKIIEKIKIIADRETLECAICDEEITKKNIGGIYYSGGQIYTLCEGCLSNRKIKEVKKELDI